MMFGSGLYLYAFVGQVQPAAGTGGNVSTQTARVNRSERNGYVTEVEENHIGLRRLSE